MARNLDPKCKKCRRAGQKLFLKGEKCQSSKCAMIKRNYPPGQHGPKGSQRLSVFGQQLAEKQKAKRIYGILEKQLKKYYTKAISQKGNTAEIITQYLETRLDNIIYRLGLASSRSMARQLVNHGHFLVNKKKVDIPSLNMKVNDVLSIKDKSMELDVIKKAEQLMKKKNTPEWLMWEPKDQDAKVLRKPEVADLTEGVDMSLIVEYYSK